MNLVLRCIDFLRDCNARLRTGGQLGSAAALLGELRTLEERDHSGATPAPTRAVESPQLEVVAPMTGTELASAVTSPDSDTGLRLTITFEPGLPLADLKARLIASRLAEFGQIRSTRPSENELETVDRLSQFELVIDSSRSREELRAAADVDGVSSIEFSQFPGRAAAGEAAAVPPSAEDELSRPSLQQLSASPDAEEPVPEISPVTVPAANAELPATSPSESQLTDGARTVTAATTPIAITLEQATLEESTQEETKQEETAPKDKVAETMRVDIGRLDNLMNLAGQLVINRARFVQVAEQLRPMVRKTNDVSRVRDFGENVRRTVEQLQGRNGIQGDWAARIRELEEGLELLERQLQLWDTNRRCIAQVNEAVDQLTRVSDSLQRGVMETRMVPVAPLFNRFKRVVRDLAMERGKTVHLKLHGEKTELDKRMIDELADPLMHLVRNCVDHGLEKPDIRAKRGKPAAGTISLEARHSGNNIHIQVRDDGSGINIDAIKRRLMEQRILSQEALEGLSDAQVVEYIWHPGLSTAAVVTDISGRGVGMDVVKTRISSLNGTVEVESVPEQGTTFTIRLPLTLAIINSLLVRIHNVIFSLPIDDVREIVSVRPRDIVTIQGKQTFDVRGQFIPLMRIDDIFTWHELEQAQAIPEGKAVDGKNDDRIDVVVLQAGSRTLGLRVAELLGSQDIVIKSLAENLIPIRGLSGASILGDGTVCLMLDVGAVLDMVFAYQEMATWKK